jgi:hypothetical protein
MNKWITTGCASVLVGAALLGITTAPAAAIGSLAVGKPQLASPVEKARCIGNRVNYRGFASCVRRNSAKHCNKICNS